LEIYSQDGRVFPITNQAASVLKVLEMELKRLSVEYDFYCSGLSFSKNNILVFSRGGKTINSRKLVITGGGKSYPVLGSDGSMYDIARQFGHTIIEPIPSAVPLVVKDNLCHFLQGQRISAATASIIDGKKSAVVKGELLFTKYGLSGTCILDISEEISIAVNRHHKKDVFVAVDMVPFMDREQLKKQLIKRQKAATSPDEILAGILPNKLSFALRNLFDKGDVDAVVAVLKERLFKVTGTKSWNEAEFTAGGIEVNEVNSATLESKLHKGVYFAGEVLDVDGRRGGYNLSWAWASGFVAGKTL
jgi:predicted Rossmann fold flavoprotein